MPDSGNALLTESDKGIFRIKLEISKKRAQDVYDGYLIYTDDYCVLIGYSWNKNQELDLINITKLTGGAWTFHILNCDLSILELRSELDDVVEGSGGGSGGSGTKLYLHTILVKFGFDPAKTLTLISPVSTAATSITDVYNLDKGTDVVKRIADMVPELNSATTARFAGVVWRYAGSWTLKAITLDYTNGSGVSTAIGTTSAEFVSDTVTEL